MAYICANLPGTISRSSPTRAAPVARIRFSPFAVSGMSVVPVCRPFSDQAVSPCRIMKTRGLTGGILRMMLWRALGGQEGDVGRRMGREACETRRAPGAPDDGGTENCGESRAVVQTEQTFERLTLFQAFASSCSCLLIDPGSIDCPLDDLMAFHLKILCLGPPASPIPSPSPKKPNSQRSP